MLLRVMKAAGIEGRDEFVAFASDFDHDDNGYLKKAELEDAAKAWNEKHGAAEDAAPEEEVAEEAAEEATAEEKACLICSMLNAADAKECTACAYTFPE